MSNFRSFFIGSCFKKPVVDGLKSKHNQVRLSSIQTWCSTGLGWSFNKLYLITVIKDDGYAEVKLKISFWALFTRLYREQA